MNFRAAEVYVQAKTKRRLRWVAKGLGDTSADELADAMLNSRIEELYPQVLELEAEYESAEKRLQAAIKVKP